jgi:outer membrane protein OmpA-like peptidoglycan-associated protein
MLSSNVIIRQPLKLLALGFVLAGIAAVVTACGTSRAAAGSGPNQSCMAAPASANRAPVTAALIGVTKNDNGSNVAGVRRAAISKVVTAAFKARGRLLVDTVGAGRADADLAVNTQLVATGPNDLFKQMNASCKQKGVAAATRRLLKRHLSGPVDVLSALQVIQSHLTGLTKEPVQVVLLSSMLNAAPPLKLNAHNLGEDPRKLIANVKHAGLLPSCTNWRVYVVGGGETATGGISAPLNVRLKSFWGAFFNACGGQLVLYDTALTQFPVTPQKVTKTHRKNLLVVTLPSAVLFDSGRWDLRAGSQAALNQLVQIVARHHSGVVTVTGYTDSTPYNGPGGNVGLSKRRAVAVVNWLVKYGVKRNRLHAVGRGLADPVASNKTSAGRQANRRVEVTMVTSQ